VAPPVDPVLRDNPLYRRLSEEDRRRLSDVSLVRTYPKGETIFSEGDPSDFLYTIANGRVKVVKMLPAGKEVILEILGAGDPLLFLKLAERVGRPEASGIFIPMSLSRQDLADLTGTTIETCIRLMSRWGKEGIVSTEKDGFRVLDRTALEKLVA
jgi:CRP-like cAMP-binding protein